MAYYAPSLNLIPSKLWTISYDPVYVEMKDIWPSERGAPHDCFLPCMIIVFFHAWLLFPSMHDCFFSCMIIVSFHAWLFPSIHDYCFLPCMWPQVIDLFPSNQAGIAGMTVSFSTVSFLFSLARWTAWEVGSIAWSGRRTNQDNCRIKTVSTLYSF